MGDDVFGSLEETSGDGPHVSQATPSQKGLRQGLEARAKRKQHSATTFFLENLRKPRKKQRSVFEKNDGF